MIDVVGNNKVRVNEGDDFVAVGGGTDTIRNFGAPFDLIALDTDLGVTHFADLAHSYSEVNGDLILNFGNGDRLILEGTQWSDLAADDFAFVWAISPRPRQTLASAVGRWGFFHVPRVSPWAWICSLSLAW
ncbi:MAG: hypothetical protein AAF829_08450 [Pseudomonadota bacterium]